jgi:hypothetical protein
MPVCYFSQPSRQREVWKKDSQRKNIEIVLSAAIRRAMLAQLAGPKWHPKRRCDDLTEGAPMSFFNSFSWVCRGASARRCARAGLAAAACLLASVAAGAQAKPAAPTVSAGAGSCSAAFTVVNGNQKPIYDAQIDLTFHYGFFNLHKTTLEAFTDSNGRARFEGLPRAPKKPLVFRIRYGDRHRSVKVNPLDQCKTKRRVVLP